MSTKVVILGAGYASVWTYRAVRRHLGAKAQITVVSPYPVHIYHGFTGEVLAGNMRTDLQESPLHEVFKNASVLIGQASYVDTSTRQVHVSSDQATSVLNYDHLVVATGAREHTELVPGLSEHGWRLHSPGMPAALLSHYDSTLRAAANIADSPVRDQLSTAVVIGAGFAGTEVAAALSRRMKDAGVQGRVVLISSTAGPIKQWADQPGLTAKVRLQLHADGVQLLTGVRATSVDALGITLDSGEVISAATVIAAVGNKAVLVDGLQSFAGPSGQLIIDDTLQVTEGVWAAGDVAQVPRHGGGFAPNDALWAIRAGTRVGRNIARVVRSRRAGHFGYRGLGCVASFRTGRAVAKFYGIPLSGLPAWALRIGFFLWFIPSRPHALRVLAAGLTGRAGDRVMVISDGFNRIPCQRQTRSSVRSKVSQ